MGGLARTFARAGTATLRGSRGGSVIPRPHMRRCDAAPAMGPDQPPSGGVLTSCDVLLTRW